MILGTTNSDLVYGKFLDTAEITKHFKHPHLPLLWPPALGVALENICCLQDVPPDGLHPSPPNPACSPIPGMQDQSTQPPKHLPQTSHLWRDWQQAQPSDSTQMAAFPSNRPAGAPSVQANWPVRQLGRRY